MITILDKSYKYVKPYYLMEVGGLKLIKACVKGSSLVWNIAGEQVTYNQIKEQLKSKATSQPNINETNTG
jgi:hypothetical protein